MILYLGHGIKQFVSNGENTGYQHLFPVPTMFSKLQSIRDIMIKHEIVYPKVKSESRKSKVILS